MILKQSFSRSQTRLCWFWRRRSRNSSSFLAVLLQLSQCSKCSLKLFKFRCILESSSSSMKYLSRERIRRGFGKLSSTPATASSSSNDAPLVGITGLGCPSAQWDCRLPLGFKDRGNSSRLRYCYPLSNNWFYFCGVHSVWKGLCQEKAFGTN